MRCVATILNRHYLGENAYAFSFDNCLVGDYDEEFDLFIDKNGNEYMPITDMSTLYSEVPQGFANVVKIEDVKKLFPDEKDLTTSDAIAMYNDQCKDISYIVGIGANGTIFTMPINISEIVDGIEGMKQEMVDEAEADKQFMEDMEEGNIPEEYVDLINDIINGKYGLEELKLLRDSLRFGRDNIESVLDTLDLQIEADTMDIPLEEAADEIKAKEKINKESKPKTEKVVVDNRSEYEKRGLMDVEKLYKLITKTLIAQDEPTRRMLVELARMDLKNHKRNGILLTGESGVGKTLLMSLIAKYCDRPFLIVDSTQLTMPGYVGKSIEEYLWDLYESCGKNKEKAEKAIVFFDEIDKKGSSRKDDVSGKGVLNVLLKFLDGTKYEACKNKQHKEPGSYVTLDTSNMKVILGGAFTDVYKNMKAKNGIGFNADVAEESDNKTPSMEDFVTKAMMTDEFMGRVPILIKMNDLDEDAIKRILLESDESALKQEEDSFDQLGVKLTVTPEFIDAIAHKAYERKTGARGINAMVTDTTWKPFDEVYSHIGDYEEVILDDETVKDNSNFQLVKKKNN